MLEDRFYELGYEIDKRTIQNWLAGNNKPSARNLHRLARVVSNDDAGFKKLWRDAFTIAKVSKPKPDPNIEPDQVISKTQEKETPKFKYLPWLVGGLVVIILLTLSALLIALRQPPVIKVTNLKFCDEARFDRTAKTFTTNVSQFPAGTSLIFVSFNMPDAPEGQPFERRWYRDGQLFLSKSGFNDSAWEDYTWIKNPNGHDHGKYVLRIIVNGRVTTGSFLLGDINEDHKSPL